MCGLRRAAKSIHEKFICKSHFLHKKTQELRCMRKYYPLIGVAFGILLIVVGVAYGVFFAGLPGPEDSPAEAARVSVHGSIAFGGVCAGVLFFLGGVLVSVFRLFSRKKRSQA
jgi:hypothetical protein